MLDKEEFIHLDIIMVGGPIQSGKSTFIDSCLKDHYKVYNYDLFIKEHKLETKYEATEYNLGKICESIKNSKENKIVIEHNFMMNKFREVIINNFKDKKIGFFMKLVDKSKLISRYTSKDKYKNDINDLISFVDSYENIDNYLYETYKIIPDIEMSSYDMLINNLLLEKNNT